MTLRTCTLAERPDDPDRDGLTDGGWDRVAAQAMTITGSLAQWREWTGLAFDASGFVAVPGALVPVHVSVEHDHAVYVEPNVWIRHAAR